MKKPSYTFKYKKIVRGFIIAHPKTKKIRVDLQLQDDKITNMVIDTNLPIPFTTKFIGIFLKKKSLEETNLAICTTKYGPIDKVIKCSA